MNPLLQKPGFQHLHGISSSNEIDELQTDVMRFMAILGLCLMMIFALVQTMPDTLPKQEITVVEQVAAVQQESRVEQKKETQQKSEAQNKKKTQPGFHLYFETENALEKLIRQEQVLFFALMGKKIWQLSLVNGHLQFLQVRTTLRYYEMDGSTVPHKFKRKFNKIAAGFNNNRIKWGVKLPNAIHSKIKAFMSANKGGNLVITEQGDVVLQ
jgi:hypothetical protein